MSSSGALRGEAQRVIERTGRGAFLTVRSATFVANSSLASSLSFLHVHTHAQLTRALARLRVLFSPSCRLLAVLDQPRSSLSGALLVLLVLQYLVRLRERL